MPDLRASDADRERVVATLREHALAGRLTVEELDERCAAAYAARTLRELVELQADLPVARPAPAAARPRRRRPLVPGRVSFAHRWYARAPADAMLRRLMADVTPPMARWGYDITQLSDGRLRFERSRRPAWTFVIAVLLFPIGLIALLHKVEERVTIDLDEDERGTQLVVTGVAPLPIRRAFAELED